MPYTLESYLGARKPRTRLGRSAHVTVANRFRIKLFCWALLLATTVLPKALGQSTNVAALPYLGWSSFSSQTQSSGFLNQTNIEAQSDALRSSVLQEHGFTYINIDDGWQKGYDSSGRPTPNSALFPDISALISHIHQNGQKAGIYWRPGAAQEVVQSNPLISGGTQYVKDILAVPHAPGNAFAASDATTSLSNLKIDFSQSAAQLYVESIVNLFASWGVDYIRLDGVAPGSGVLTVDNQEEVQAWAQAISKSGRPMWLTVSTGVELGDFSTWGSYSNARRIGAAIECKGSCSTLTDWALTSERWFDLIGWQNFTSAQTGWNDLGPLEIGTPATVGLSGVEQQSAITLWAMANAPIYVGGDISAIDSDGTNLLTNDEVLGVDQSGEPATQLAGGLTPVWGSAPSNGVFYVALFNLNAFPAEVTVRWKDLGFLDALNVRDVWNRKDLGPFKQKFSSVILGHGARLLRVSKSGVVDPQSSQSYPAFLGKTHGKTAFIRCPGGCASGHEVVKLGLEKENYVDIEGVSVEKSGIYRMKIDAATYGPSDLFYQPNGGAETAVKIGGSSFGVPSNTIVPVFLKSGENTIRFTNPTGMAPYLDVITIIGNGDLSDSHIGVYDAEVGVLEGNATHTPCEYCSGNTKVITLGGKPDNDVLFDNVVVQADGVYMMEIDFVAQGTRPLWIKVNHEKPFQLSLTGDSDSLPTSMVIPVALKQGKNSITVGGGKEDAPGVDKIVIGPSEPANHLAMGLVSRKGTSVNRVWTLELANLGNEPLQAAQVNSFAFVQVSGQGACQPSILTGFPIVVGDIPAQSFKTFELAMDFSGCSFDARFNTSTSYSADRGAVAAGVVDVSLEQ
ncbi:alpha-galactosidase D [Granulicella mallensis]|uniref:Alpha-galactosidase n=1 Tax=Granulicella mallensis (strain ATCC BAA-1857 / DSM 23137 / MP5ACTX8) TaxID=682795 RepID=G8NWB7_GRAMM|nr:alpha-galactosidase [Granulicella mallensis]AEU36629.1 Alpha-galactosidase [Granulicella mallensis MP5ACTX8]